MGRHRLKSGIEVEFRKENGASYFQFAQLAAYSNLWHGIFTRHAGYSETPYDSLNVAIGIGDDINRVQQNRKIISRCAGNRDLTFCRQEHGTRVVAFNADRPENHLTAGQDPPVGDAMVTNMPGKFLAIQVADCQPVLLYDPVRQVIANVHAGWRGSIQGILMQTVQTLTHHFGCRPADMIAAIGPSLGPCCAEFIHYKSEIPDIYWKYKDNADHFDFWAISRDQLHQAGLLPAHIHSSNLCTRCRRDHFFSYRGEGTTGRFAAVIGLKMHL